MQISKSGVDNHLSSLEVSEDPVMNVRWFRTRTTQGSGLQAYTVAVEGWTLDSKMRA